MRAKRTSVVSIVVLVIVAIVSSLLGVAGWAGYALYGSRERAALRATGEMLTDQAAAALAGALWNFDETQVRQTVESFMKDRQVAAIVVREAGTETVVLALARDAGWKPVRTERVFPLGGELSAERKVVYSGRVVGRVQIVVSSAFLEENLRRIRDVLMVFILVVAALLTTALYLLLWRVLLRPIRMLEAYAHQVSLGASDRSAFQAVPFSRELDSLRTSIARMVTLLESRLTELQAAGAGLRESEERFRRLFNGAADAVFVHDQAGRIVDVNQVACESIGCPREEMLRLTVSDIEVSLRPDALADLWEKMRGGPRATVEGVHRRRDGSTFPVEVRIAPFPSAERVLYFAAARDVTDRKQAEQALQESEAKYRRLYESMNDAYAKVDMTGVIVESNPAFRALLGYSEGELRGLSYLELTPQRWHATESAIVQEQVLVRGFSDVYEKEYQRKDGTILPIELRTFLLRDDDGQPVAMWAIVRDIAERKRAENELRKLSRVVEQSPAAIVITERSGRIEYVNPAFERLTGYTADEARGCNPRILKSGETAAETYRELWSTITAGRTWFGQFRNRRKNGELFWEQACIAPVTDQSGAISRFVAIKEDITEQKRVEAELAQHRDHLEEMVRDRTAELNRAREAADAANRAKSIFLAQMSHEIRTPMNAILGFAQLMGRDRALSTTQREHLGIIGRNGEHLLTLIDNILEMSKIEARQAILQPKAFDLRAFAQDLQATFAAAAAAKGLALTLEQSPALPHWVSADDGKLRQILINLVGNAVKFTSSGQVILRFWAASREPCNWLLAVEIEDTGPGIAADEIDRLFQPFEQASLGRGSGSGTGLGLAISRELARMMGGDVTLKSVPGRGSVFRVEVTVQAHGPEVCPAAAAVADRSADEAVLSASACRVLVVDDLEDNRRLLREMLARRGLPVREAAGGAEAIRIFSDWRPPLILMDLRMSEIDGLETTRMIRARPDGRHTKIVCLSASAFAEDRDRALAAGVDDFLAKPFREEELFEKLETLLNLRPETAPAPRATPAPPTESGVRLPDELIDALQNAALEVDIDRIATLVGKVRTYDDGLADKLSACAARYDYERFMILVRAAGGGSIK